MQKKDYSKIKNKRLFEKIDFDIYRLAKYKQLKGKVNTLNYVKTTIPSIREGVL